MWAQWARCVSPPMDSSVRHTPAGPEHEHWCLSVANGKYCNWKCTEMPPVGVKSLSPKRVHNKLGEQCTFEIHHADPILLVLPPVNFHLLGTRCGRLRWIGESPAEDRVKGMMFVGGALPPPTIGRVARRRVLPFTLLPFLSSFFFRLS